MKLFNHQIEALEQTKDYNRCAYYLDMGLGKTFVGSEKLVRLGAKFNLVICQKSKVEDWCLHFYEHYDETEVYDLTNKDDFEWFFKDHTRRFKVGVINYELAWRRPELHKLKDFTLMLDESSLIQNRKAKQTKFIMKLRPTNVILLSGTPCSGKYENLLSQIHLLGWNITEDMYNKHYVMKQPVRDKEGKILRAANGQKFYEVVGYKNIDRLKSKLRDYGSVFMKTDEVFDLPEQNFIEIKVDSSSAYNKFMRRKIVKVEDKELVGDTSLTKLLYARQLCSIYSESKLNAFSDLVESTNDRLIVFYNFNEELERLIEVATKNNRPVSIVNGSIKNLSHYEEDEDSITFIQYQAGSMGLNLQLANKIIYYSLPLRSDLFEQSKKRIHRIGQNKACFYYSMICKKSVEEDICNTLAERRDYTNELFEKVQ